MCSFCASGRFIAEGLSPLSNNQTSTSCLRRLWNGSRQELSSLVSGRKACRCSIFHLRQDDVLVEDPDGSDLPDLAAALAKANEDARILLAERTTAAMAIKPWKIEVADEDGVTLADVHFLNVLFGLISG